MLRIMFTVYTIFNYNFIFVFFKKFTCRFFIIILLGKGRQVKLFNIQTCLSSFAFTISKGHEFIIQPKVHFNLTHWVNTIWREVPNIVYFIFLLRNLCIHNTCKMCLLNDNLRRNYIEYHMCTCVNSLLVYSNKSLLQCCISFYLQFRSTQ